MHTGNKPNVAHGFMANPPPYEGLPPIGPGQSGPYGPPGPYGPHLVQTATYPTVYPAVVITQQMGPESTRMTCRFCQKEINTRIEYRPTIRTHLFAALLCAVGCIPCAFVPYCVDSCQSTDHFCPNCKAYMGSYNS